jgi:hypothetical protein
MSVRDDAPPTSNESGPPITTGLKRVVAASMAGSLAPIIAVKLLEVYDSSVPIALYLAGAAVVTLIAVYFTRETKGIDLATVDQADRDDLAKAGVA